MIYEIRTYTLKPGMVPEMERRVAEVLPNRLKLSKMAALWHTEIGPLNQVVDVWPYEDLNQRAAIREEALKDPNWPPKTLDLIVTQQAEIFHPAPFMRPMEPGQIGNIYEMRIYTYQPGTIPEVLKRWGEVVPHREKYSPLAACWYSELGTLNKFIHVWPYADLVERERIRGEAGKDPHWPPKTQEFLVHMENKILIPAAFSPLK